jgi:hypothetical protein
MEEIYSLWIDHFNLAKSHWIWSALSQFRDISALSGCRHFCSVGGDQEANRCQGGEDQSHAVQLLLSNTSLPIFREQESAYQIRTRRLLLAESTGKFRASLELEQTAPAVTPPSSN